MFVVKQCKVCGNNVEFDCREIPTEKPSLDGNQAFWLRLWTRIFLGASVIIAIIAYALIQDVKYATEREVQLLKDPAVKIDIQEMPNSRPMRKFTREAK